MGNTVAARQNSGANRHIAVNIAGEPAAIDCPAWCERDHSGRHNEAEDIRHEGGHRAVLIPAFPAGQRPVLNFWRADAPFEGGAHVALLADGDEVEELTTVQARKLADDLMAHASALVALVAQIEADQEAARPAVRAPRRRGFVIPPSAGTDTRND